MYAISQNIFSIIFSNTIASGHISRHFVFNFWQHHFRFWFMADFVIFTIFKGQKSRIFNVPYLGTKKRCKIYWWCYTSSESCGMGLYFYRYCIESFKKIWRKTYSLFVTRSYMYLVIIIIIIITIFTIKTNLVKKWSCLSISSSLTVMNFANKI